MRALIVLTLCPYLWANETDHHSFWPLKNLGFLPILRVSRQTNGLGRGFTSHRLRQTAFSRLWANRFPKFSFMSATIVLLLAVVVLCLYLSDPHHDCCRQSLSPHRGSWCSTERVALAAPGSLRIGFACEGRNPRRRLARSARRTRLARTDCAEGNQPSTGSGDGECISVTAPDLCECRESILPPEITVPSHCSLTKFAGVIATEKQRGSPNAGVIQAAGAQSNQEQVPSA